MNENSHSQYYAQYRLFKYLVFFSWPVTLITITAYSTYTNAHDHTTPQKSTESISKRSILMTGTQRAETLFQKKKNNVLFSRLSTQYGSHLLRPTPWTVTMGAMVVSFKLSTRFPHTFIDGKGQNMLTHTSNDLWVLNSKLKNAHRIMNPEGLQVKDFAVYSAAENDSDVLRILTRDVIEAILGLGRNIDVEIIDDQVNIIIDRKTLRTKSVSMTAANIDHAIKEFLHALNNSRGYWNHDLVLNTSTIHLPLMQIAYALIYYTVIFVLIVMVVLFISVSVGTLIGELLRFIF